MFHVVPTEFKKELLFVQFVYCVGAFLQLSGITLIVFFLELISSSEKIMEFQTKLGLNMPNDKFILNLSICLFVGYFLINVFNLITDYYANKITFKLKWHISEDLFYYYLNKNYSFHLKNPSNELINNVQTQVDRLTNKVMLPIIVLFSKLILVIILSGYLFYLYPRITCFLMASFVTIYFVLFYVIKRLLFRIGKELSKLSSRYIKILNEAFGAIKEIKVYGLAYKLKNDFSKIMEDITKNVSLSYLLSESPRFLVESFAVGVFFIFIAISIKSVDFVKLIPQVSLFAAVAYKLLPALQGIYYSLSKFKSNIHALDVLYEDLYKAKIEKKSKSNESAVTQDVNCLKLSNVSFGYATNNIITNFNLEINSPFKLAIVGESGGGKTTLIDLVLGLLQPNEGSILTGLNEGSDPQMCSYVPQTPFIFNDSLAFNISLKHELTEDEKSLLNEVIKVACLEEILPDGVSIYVYNLGERGGNLSGGQKQRIAIARALFFKRKIVIFDESTSALDPQLEEKVLNNVMNFLDDKIFIFATHRLSTLKYFQQIAYIKNGNLVDYGSLEHVIRNSPEFFKYAQLNY